MFKQSLDNKSIVMILLLKAFLVLIGLYFSFSTQTYSTTNLLANFHYPSREVSTLNAFTAWDGRFYWYLADNGYAGKISSAFYPLYPALMRILSVVMPTPIAGLLLSNLFFVLAGILFYRLCLDKFNATVANFALVAWLLYPASFFLNLVYTEALFLFLSLACFYSLDRRCFFYSSIFAALLVLARPVGIFIVPALVVYAIRNRKIVAPFKLWALVVLPCFAYLSFGLLIMYTSGTSSFSAQNYFIGQNSLSNIFSLLTWFKANFYDLSFSFNGINTSLLNRSFFIVALFFLIYSYGKLSVEVLIFTILLVLIPALSGEFVGYLRYLAPVFALFGVIGLTCSNFLIPQHQSRQILISLIGLAAIALQAYFIYLYANNYWVS